MINNEFSIYELGVIDTMMSDVSYDEINIGTVGTAILKSNTSNIYIDNLKKSITSETYFGSLKIGHIAEDFSAIKLEARSANMQIALTEKHNFKATILNSFGDFKAGNVIFNGKHEDNNEFIFGTVGKFKEPTAIVEISNSYGKIAFE